MTGQEDIFKIFKHTERNSSGCYEWLGGNSGSGRGGGYGRIRYNGKVSAVHRLVYELTKGEIPESYHIDHLCRNRICCNPDHLECVTPKENQRRKYI